MGGVWGQVGTVSLPSQPSTEKMPCSPPVEMLSPLPFQLPPIYLGAQFIPPFLQAAFPNVPSCMGWCLLCSSQPWFAPTSVPVLKCLFKCFSRVTPNSTPRPQTPWGQGCMPATVVLAPGTCWHGQSLKTVDKHPLDPTARLPHGQTAL